MRDAFRRNGGYMDGGNASVEMSKMDNKIPKHYKGHDMDELFEKEIKGQLTQEECGIITEAFNVCYPPKKISHLPGAKTINNPFMSSLYSERTDSEGRR